MFDKLFKRWLILCFVICSAPGWCANEVASVLMEDLTWVELKARIDSGAKSVILPTGGIEQNGPYIALGKHNWVVAFASHEIASSLGNTLVAPMLKVVPQGSMEAPSGNLLFPGTLALRDDTFERVLSDMVLSLAYAGFQNIYLLGDHGLSQPIQAGVAVKMQGLLKAANVRVWNVSEFYKPEMEAAYLTSQGIAKELHGEHAGIADMAQIMALSPSYVRQPQKLNSNPETLGFSGRPDLATPELGKALLRLRIEAAISQIKQFP